MRNDVTSYLDDHAEEALRLLIELARIPAPSHQEERRAEFCLNWLRSVGADGAYIDEALNVIYPVGDTGENDLMVFMAHSDVVFPNLEPLPLRVEDGRIYCPGVGDDTAKCGGSFDHGGVYSPGKTGAEGLRCSAGHQLR